MDFKIKMLARLENQMFQMRILVEPNPVGETCEQAT
jgi:hypothetical protein